MKMIKFLGTQKFSITRKNSFWKMQNLIIKFIQNESGGPVKYHFEGRGVASLFFREGLNLIKVYFFKWPRYELKVRKIRKWNETLRVEPWYPQISSVLSPKVIGSLASTLWCGVEIITCPRMGLYKPSAQSQCPHSSLVSLISVPLSV